MSSGARLTELVSRQPTPRGLLVVSDEAVTALARLLEESGFRVVEVRTADAALSVLRDAAPEAVILDVGAAHGAGMELARALRSAAPGVPLVALCNADSSSEAAADLAHLGVFDVLSKPIETDRLLGALRRLRDRGFAPPTSVQELPDLPRHSSAMDRLCREMKQVAPLDCTVLLQGETGAGKGVIARWLHGRGPAPDGPFVVADCAAMKPDLIESELFGHERGAFTGAIRRRQGHVEQADGGTLFLDEIGELDECAQARLLRFLDDHTFQRVGGSRSLRSRCRVIAATHRDVARLVAARRFRADLYHRLDVLRLRIPPLRDRTEDLLPLAHQLLWELCRDQGRPIPSLGPCAVAQLCAYAWPGNVRELRNVLLRSLLARTEETLERLLLPVDDAEIWTEANDPPTLREVRTCALAAVEREYLEKLLARHRGNVTTAAVAAGIARNKLYAKIRKYGLSLDVFRGADRERRGGSRVR